VNEKGVNEIKEWMKTLQKRELAKINQKLDMLEKAGPDLSPELLAGTHQRHIKKIRATGRVTIRLMVCRGPLDPNREFTLLYGAFERDRKLVPPNAEELAERNRSEVLKDPPRRRKKHERIG
jgi:hypothetical protein